MKMICVHCAKMTECSCPEDHSKDFKGAKYICDICMKLLDAGVKEEELKAHPKRKEIERDLKTEMFADYFSEEIVSAFFNQFWDMTKKDVKHMSKKEITKEAYAAGAHMAILLSSKMAMDEKLIGAIREVTVPPEAKP